MRGVGSGISQLGFVRDDGGHPRFDRDPTIRIWQFYVYLIDLPGTRNQSGSHPRRNARSLRLKPARLILLQAGPLQQAGPGEERSFSIYPA